MSTTAFSTERVMMFVDGSNIYWAARNRGLRVDYQKLRDVLVGQNRRLVRPYYFCSIGVPPSQGQIRFQDMLKFSGYSVIQKPLRHRRFTANDVNSGQRVTVERWGEKGVDVALVTDMLSMGYKNAYDTAILVGGDEDYLSAVKDIKSIPKRVEVAAFSNTDQANTPPAYKSTINRNMRMEADAFIALENIESQITV